MKDVNENEINIANILMVKNKQSGDVHYEKVIQIHPEIITKDMDDEIECSTQGISDNFQYEIIDDYKIVRLLLNKIKINAHHCICISDQYGGVINPECLIHGNK